jgi:hemerythrin
MEIKEHSIRRDVSDEMTQLLHNWLVGHIHTVDKATYRTCARRRST